VSRRRQKLQFLLAALLLSLRVSGGESYRITDRVIPTGFAQEVHFLEILKSPEEPRAAYDANKGPRWNLPPMAPYISSLGIEFTDVNHARQGHVSRSDILRQLATRRGLAFDVFAHLSHIYSIPYKQYSELRFSSRDRFGGSVVGVASWYRLTFALENGRSVITKIDYQMLEGE
jgi:hypothetical protein